MESRLYIYILFFKKKKIKITNKKWGIVLIKLLIIINSSGVDYNIISEKYCDLLIEVVMVFYKTILISSI